MYEAGQPTCIAKETGFGRKARPTRLGNFESFPSVALFFFVEDWPHGCSSIVGHCKNVNIDVSNGSRAAAQSALFVPIFLERNVDTVLPVSKNTHGGQLVH